MRTRSVGSTGNFGNEEFRRRRRELPPSAKLVAAVLDDAGPPSRRQVADRSLLPARTVRNARRCPEESDLPGSRYGVPVARAQGYAVPW